MSKFKNFILLAASFLTIIIFTAGSISAQEAKKASEWEIGAEVYLWGASVDGSTTSGSPVQLDFDDILDNLEMGFMGLFSAKKNKWSFLVDAIYLDVEDDATVGPGVRISAELKGWIVTPAVSYNLIDSTKGSLDLLGGARYLYLDAELEEGAARIEDTSKIWDGIVGVRGSIKLTDKWHLPYHLDVGAGESDLTWQAFGGVGYKFGSWDVIVAYRYLSWEYDGKGILDDLSLYGPVIGVKFTF